MARVSFGSRAGTKSDYLAGGRDFTIRINAPSGPLKSVDDLCDVLRREINASAESSVPECCTSELSLHDDASVPLLRPSIGPYADGGIHDLPSEFKTGWATFNHGPADTSYPHATAEGILAISDAQTRQIVQRAASRGIVQAIESIDGFKYSFNNAWAAKDEDGQRFSYICQDSRQNKDRHANAFHKTLKHLKGVGDRGPRKPTYDCKGSVSIKFSGARKAVYVYYRHYAIHGTVEEMKHSFVQQPWFRPTTEATPPTPVDEGGLAASLQAQPAAYVALPPMQPQLAESSNLGRPLKRKRESETARPAHVADKPLSLSELLRQTADAKLPPPSTAQASSKPIVKQHNGDAVTYSLPSWQAPTLQAPPAARRPGATATYPAPYQPPYQPPQYPPPQSQPTPTQSQSSKRPSQPQQQVFQGQPKYHSQSQGLFTTLKPVAVEPSQSQPQALQAITYNYPLHRAKTSCTHCRISKKKASHCVHERDGYLLTSGSVTRDGRCAVRVSSLARASASTKVHLGQYHKDHRHRHHQSNIRSTRNPSRRTIRHLSISRMLSHRSRCRRLRR